MRNIICFMFTLIILSGCEQNNYSPNGINIDSSINSMFDRALVNRTQTFVFPANTGTVCKSSAKGVEICLNTDCFELNGGPVTSGEISLDYIEIFDKGDMVVTNKTTTDGATGEMLKTGGEFYLQAYLNGSPLSVSSSCDYSGFLNIDPSLTGGFDWEMDVWTGSINGNGDLNWEPVLIDVDTLAAINGDLGGGEGYTLPFLGGWNNCDVFYSWPSPKTTVSVNIPSEYDGTNSRVFILYNSEDGSVAYFNYEGADYFQSYDSSIPVGIDAHILFVLEYSNQDLFGYALESVTIAENQEINFSSNDLQMATESEMVDIINLLP